MYNVSELSTPIFCSVNYALEAKNICLSYKNYTKLIECVLKNIYTCPIKVKISMLNANTFISSKNKNKNAVSSVCFVHIDTVFMHHTF